MVSLSCPLCQYPLVRQERTLRCSNNHSFDQAKQGYWHLLPVQKKRSRMPGDNNQMVNARTRFLEKGYYQSFATVLCERAKYHLNACQTPNLLDMGCGEGYYTQALADAITTPAHIIGLDISKEAIKAAARRSRAITWIVASGADMPIPDHSQDLLCVLFSRLMPAALEKALKPKGTLLYAWPGTQHLKELRQAIYTEVKPSRFDPINELSPYFTLENIVQHQFNFTITLADDLDALLMMTPHGHRIKPEKRQQLLDQRPLNLTFDVNLGAFKRHNIHATND